MSQIEGISVETLMLANKYTDEHGGGGGEAAGKLRIPGERDLYIAIRGDVKWFTTEFR